MSIAYCSHIFPRLFPWLGIVIADNLYATKKSSLTILWQFYIYQGETEAGNFRMVDKGDPHAYVNLYPFQVANKVLVIVNLISENGAFCDNTKKNSVHTDINNQRAMLYNIFK